MKSQIFFVCKVCLPVLVVFLILACPLPESHFKEEVLPKGVPFEFNL